MSRFALQCCYLCFIRPLLEYRALVFDNCSQNDKNTTENIQYNHDKALRLITGCKKVHYANSYWRKLEFALIYRLGKK